ncbi:MAG: hypothetical protein L0Z54_06535, partial [Thermoplasmata archaeon]|nr:hypothetical protein [Thermoplasmata archaeon]
MRLAPWLTFMAILPLLAIAGHGLADGSDWPMFGHDQRHTSMSSVAEPLDDPVELWDNDNAVAGLGVAHGDLTENIDFINGSSASDVTDDHLIYAVGRYLYVVEATTGRTVWLLDVAEADGNSTDDDAVATAPVVDDVDSDGDVEIIFATTDGSGQGMLYCFSPAIEYDGEDYDFSANNHDMPERVWRKPLAGPVNISQPLLTTIKDIGKVVAIGAANTLHVVKANDRATVWEVELEGTDISTPAAVPVSETNNIAVSTVDWDDGIVYFYVLDDTDGSERMKEELPFSSTVPHPFPGDVLPSAAVAELDGNATNGREVVYVKPYEGNDHNGIVHAYNWGGDLYWATSVSDISGQIEASPAIADLDGDGTMEVVVVSWDIEAGDYVMHVYILDGSNGEVIVEREMDLDGGNTGDDARAVCSPALHDIDGDGTLDVVGALYRTAFALSGDPSDDLATLWSHDCPFRVWAQPALFNLDDDLYSEALIGSLVLVQDVAELHPVNAFVDPDDP